MSHCINQKAYNNAISKYYDDIYNKGLQPAFQGQNIDKYAIFAGGKRWVMTTIAADYRDTRGTILRGENGDK